MTRPDPRPDRAPARPGLGWRSLVAVGRRSEIAVSAVMAVMLAMVAFSAVAAPRLLRTAEEASLVEAIEQAAPSDRRLTVRLIDDFSQGFDDDPLEEQRERLDEVVAGIDAAVLDRYGEPRFLVDSSRFSVAAVGVVEAPSGEPAADDADPPPPDLPTFLTFRIHPELATHSRLVGGRPAERSDRRIDGLSIFEFELTPESASELGWELDEMVRLTTDSTDLVTRQFNGGLPGDFVAQLVGLRELDPPADAYWAGDARLHRPTVADTGTGANVFAFGMIAVDQIPTRPFMVRQRSPFSLEQRRDLVDGAVNLETADESLAGLVALDAAYARQPTLTRPGVSAGLLEPLETERDQRRAARATIVLAAVGVFGVVLTTLGQFLLASFARRRGWLTVARARGASRVQVVVGSVAEMMVIATVAVVVGGALAALMIGGARTGLETSLLAGLWAGAIGAAGLIAASEGFRPVTVSARPTAHPGLGRWGRIAGALLVVIALAALVTFRRRGLATDSPDVDTLVVLLPVLVPLAVVFLTRWVLPVVLGQVARRGMALGPGRLLGLRRVIDAPDASVGLMTVLVLALTVAALGLGVNRSLERGAVDASWVAVGAPYRIDDRDRGLADAIGALPGAVVSASGSTRINIDRDQTTFNVQFVSLDVPELRELTGGTAADASYPESMEQPDLAGRAPIVASERMGGQRVIAGDVLTGVGSRAGQEFVVVQTRSEAFGRRNGWIIVDRTVYAAVAGVEPAFDSLAIGVPDEQRPALETIAADAGEDLAVRSDVLAVQRDDPLSRAVRAGYLVAGGMAVLLAVLALVAVAVITARERRREIAILGLLGSGRREITQAVASELIPAALAGVATGSIVGYLVVRSYDDRFDLSAFAGGSRVSIGPDLLGATAVGAVLALVAVGVIVGLVRRIVHAPVGEILRIDGAA